MYPACEAGNEDLTSSQAVTVRFERPCTDLSLATTTGEYTWLLNESIPDAHISLVVSGYEFASGNNIENLDAINLYYKIIDDDNIIKPELFLKSQYKLCLWSSSREFGQL